MLRIKHTVSTVAVVLATVGLIAPAAQANADGLYPRFAPKEHFVPSGTAKITIDQVPLPTAQSHRGTWLEHRALEFPVTQPKAHVTGRVIATDGGTDWTFPVMGAVALVLVMMIVGEQIRVRRRLAT